MSFLYLFDTIGFDENGDISSTKDGDLSISNSNYLYLLSKYNQAFLQDKGEKVPMFFKEELSNILDSVESGKSFSEAKREVLENCVPQVVNIADNSKNDKELLTKLNEKVSIKDREFAEKFKKSSNKLELEYIITLMAGKIFESATTQALDPDTFKAKDTKSKLFKNIIKYNKLIYTANKVKESTLSCDEVIKTVG